MPAGLGVVILVNPYEILLLNATVGSSLNALKKTEQESPQPKPWPLMGWQSAHDWSPSGNTKSWDLCCIWYAPACAPSYTVRRWYTYSVIK